MQYHEESEMNKSRTTGILLATAAAACFGTANIAAAEETTAMNQVMCAGINACKGMSECASASNSCKGHNSCKGQGWVHTTQEDCDAKGGTVVQN